MRSIEEEGLRKNLTGNPALPTIFDDNGLQVWVDRYYLAYSAYDDPLVHYVYIAREHAREELVDLPQRIVQGDVAPMLRDIARQLKRALRRGTPDYLLPRYRRRMGKAATVKERV